MWLYNYLSGLRYPRSYLGKILLVSFLGVHVPLIGLVGYIVLASSLAWPEVLPILIVTLVATLFGTGATLAALYALLSPVRAASKAVRDYLAAKTVPALPTGALDEAGRLMADVQEGITRLDIALDAAHAARLRAEEDRRSKFELLSRMSHELRTPLNHIIGFSEVMQHEMLGPLGGGAYVGYAGDINASGAGLLELIQSVLDLSQIESGGFVPETEAVDVAAVAVHVVALKRMLANQADVRIDLGGQAMLPTIAADPRAIKQIMLQIVSAAIAKAAPASTVKVALRRAGLAVSVICETTGEPLVRDDVPTAIASAFEGDAARLPASAGSESLSATGLALALTHSLTTLSGATLTVANTDANTGTGCRFALSFPIEAGSSRAGAAAA